MSSYMDDLKSLVGRQGKDPRKVIQRETPQPEILNEKADKHKSTEEKEEEEKDDLKEEKKDKAFSG